jgi:NADH-quinone oxidoreductase subunit N
VSLRQDAAPHEGAAPAEAQPADAAPAATAKLSTAELNKALEPVRKYIVVLVSLLSAITCTFGNLAAYAQTNIKRLLAYSTIAHAGYLMMPVVAAVSLAGTDPYLAREAVAGMAFYIATYLFMNLGAFAIVAFLRNAMHSEEIADYAGLIRSCPGVTICLATILLSLVGLPPLVGFIAKVAIFYPLVAAGQYTLLVIGGLNTVLSLFYYLRVVKIMTLAPEPESRPPVSLPMISLPGVYTVAISLPVLILGVANNTLLEWATAAAAQLVK